jgi:hypothetical protein
MSSALTHSFIHPGESIMQLNELTQLTSDRGVRAALRSLFYGSRSQLITAAANIKGMNITVERLRRDGYQDRATMVIESPRYCTLKAAMDSAAMRCASIDSLAQRIGFVLETDFNPILQTGKTKDQIKAAAEATGIDEKRLTEIEEKGIRARFARDADAQLDAEQAFYSTAGDDDIDVKASTVLKAFERERNRMLEWSNLDLGELVLMRHDIAVLERMVDFEERDVEKTEGSIDNEVAEALSLPRSLSAIYDEYRKEIASVRENQRKLEALEMKQAAAGNPPKADTPKADTPTKPEKSGRGRRMSKVEHAVTANQPAPAGAVGEALVEAVAATSE